MHVHKFQVETSISCIAESKCVDVVMRIGDALDAVTEVEIGQGL